MYQRGLLWRQLSILPFRCSHQEAHARILAATFLYHQSETKKRQNRKPEGALAGRYRTVLYGCDMSWWTSTLFVARTNL